MVYAIPKYTQYQLSQLVRSKLQNMNMSVQKASLNYSVDEELLQDILGEQVKFKSKHYQVVSTITGHSIEELLKDEEIQPISFRSVHDEEDQVVIAKIDVISDFFKDVALFKKLTGEIAVND